MVKNCSFDINLDDSCKPQGASSDRVLTGPDSENPTKSTAKPLRQGKHSRAITMFITIDVVTSHH